MKAEKIILSFVAVIVGLIAAGVAFYLYQMTKTIPDSKNQTISVKPQITPSPTPNNENFLTIENPKDEEVASKQTITISGKTTPKANIIVSSETSDQVVTPSETGAFTLTQPIEEGTNVIQITAVFSNGEEKKVIRTVTYSTENF